MVHHISPPRRFLWLTPQTFDIHEPRPWFSTSITVHVHDQTMLARSTSRNITAPGMCCRWTSADGEAKTQSNTALHQHADRRQSMIKDLQAVSTRYKVPLAELYSPSPAPASGLNVAVAGQCDTLGVIWELGVFFFQPYRQHASESLCSSLHWSGAEVMES